VRQSNRCSRAGRTRLTTELSLDAAARSELLGTGHPFGLCGRYRFECAAGHSWVRSYQILVVRRQRLPWQRGSLPGAGSMRCWSRAQTAARRSSVARLYGRESPCSPGRESPPLFSTRASRAQWPPSPAARGPHYARSESRHRLEHIPKRLTNRLTSHANPASDSLSQNPKRPAKRTVANPHEAPHNPKVAGSNPAPAMKKASKSGLLAVRQRGVEIAV
jgi:hypothetical protein